MPRWVVRSREIHEIVDAEDQWEAWDTLRVRSAFDFGLIATAERDEDADPIPVHTATLMRRWGREEDAEAFDQVARDHGLIA
jgi:hypothetical protein